MILLLLMDRWKDVKFFQVYLTGIMMIYYQDSCKHYEWVASKIIWISKRNIVGVEEILRCFGGVYNGSNYHSLKIVT